MTDQQATDEKAKEAEYPSYIGKTNNISTELTNLRKEYGAKYKDLYEREYEYVGPFDYKNKNIATVHLMQFNILVKSFHSFCSSLIIDYKLNNRRMD